MKVHPKTKKYVNDLAKSQLKKTFSLPFSEAELLKGMTPQKAHSEMIAVPLEQKYRFID